MNDPNLRQLMTYGPKFRDFSASNPLVILEESLKSFIAARCGDKVNPSIFTAWKTEFLKEAKERLKSMHTPTPKPLLLKSKNELRALKKSLVLVPADKAANNIIFVCKRLYTHIIRKELTKADGAYRPETRTKKEILDEHKEFLNKWKLGQVNELPTQYALPKMHKMPKITCRSIAASSKCSVKAPSQLLGKMLTCISDTIRNLNDNILITTGVRRYFVIKDGYEVSDFLAGWRRHKIHTHHVLLTFRRFTQLYHSMTSSRESVELLTKPEMHKAMPSSPGCYKLTLKVRATPEQNG